MCDSDDTDVLLLIPPDFFIVPSSDDSTENTSKLSYKPLESTFMNTLLAQVNTLQTRLSIIESQSESVDNSFSKPPSKYHRELIPSRRRILGSRARSTMSNEAFKNVMVSSAPTTPKKPSRRLRANKFLSSPSTATDFDDIYQDGKENTQVKQSPAGSVLTTRYPPSGNSFDSLNASFSPPKRRGTNLSLKELDARYKTNGNSQTKSAVLDSSDEVSSSTIDTETSRICKDRKILNEIQTFLRSVECIKSHLMGKMDPGDSSLDISFLTSPQFKAITQKHFNRKIIGLNSVNKSKKIKKSKISKFSETTNQITDCPDSPDINKSDSEVKQNLLNVTNDSTISLMQSFEGFKTVSNNSNASQCNTNSTNSSKIENSNNISQSTQNFDENNLNESQKCAQEKTNARKAIQDALYVISNLKYATEQTDQSVPEHNSKVTQEPTVEFQQTTDNWIEKEKKLFSDENYATEKWKTRQKQFQQEIDEGAAKNAAEEETQNHTCTHLFDRFQHLTKILEDKNTAFANKISVPEVSDKGEKFHQEEPPSAKSENCTNPLPNLALLSLSSLWGKQSTTNIIDTASSVVVSKIEEERYRRQHCEKLIEALQVRLLESQEKLSVAVKVDAAKDEAIVKLKDTCLVAQERCKQYEIERNEALEEVKKIKTKLLVDAENSEKKIKYYEEEINKALDIARDSQNQATELYANMEKLNMELEKSLSENKVLSDRINQLQKHIDEDKMIMSEIRNAAAETKHVITTSQAEIKQLKNEKETLEKQLLDEKQKITRLESEKQVLENLIEDTKNSEKKFLLEKENLSTDIERVKVELRTFYQRQVEIVVKDKLAEFQEQLDTAEKAFQNELVTTKLEVAKTAAEFMRDTVDKHKLEIQLLEERHSEELKLCYLKRQQTEMIVENLRRKLHYQNINRAKLASKLHDLMETQWREAIRIVSTNGTLSPASGSETSLTKPDSIMTIQKILGDELNLNDDLEKYNFDPKFDLHKLRQRRPHSAPDELPTSDKDKGTNNYLKPVEIPDFKKLSDVQSISSGVTDNPFEKDGQLTHRSNEISRKCSEPTTRDCYSKTPVTSRDQKSKNVCDENDLQKYMKMLLGKDTVPYSTSELASGDYKTTDKIEESSCYKSADCNKVHFKPHKDNLMKTLKPPWK